MKTKKTMNNLEIANLLKALAASLKIKDEKKNRFRIIAYERAATAIEHLSSEAKDLWDEDKLTEVSGIGKSIADNLGEIFEKGNSKHFEEILKKVPESVFELIKVPGIGPKRAYRITTEHKVSDKHPLDDLKKLIEKNAIAEMEGFGEDSQEAIKESLLEYEEKPEKRMRLNYAQTRADELIAWMKQDSNVEEINPLGSLRRKVSTIGDIDLAAATKNGVKTIKHFINFPKKVRVLGEGEKSASILIPGNIHVDLKVVDPSQYGSLLQHFTGSKEHNIELREHAQKMGLSLNEFGIKKGNSLLKYDSELDFYKELGMQTPPPEIREGKGEIEAALKNKLPDLVKLSDIKADLQIHSDFDIETSHDLGQSTMEVHIERANELGYEYLAFTEHNPSQSGHNDNEITVILKKKKEKIEQINETLLKKSKGSVQKVYNSLEIDMLPNGGLPVPVKAMNLLDFALVSIHSSFNKSKKEMTKRVVKSLEHPKAKIFAHPTGRLLGEREGVEIDWDEVFDYCLKNNKWIEINADPARLDLPDFLIMEAIEAGVKLTLGTDSHFVGSMDNMRYGVWMARRGWCEPKDIINTLSQVEFEKLMS